MEIKTKKTMHLPTLIQWAWENGIKNQIFRADKQLMNIQFDEHGDFRTYGFDGTGTTFTVEVEEEITEDTIISKMLLVYSSGDSHFVKGRSIKYLSKSCIEAIHILNNDLTLTLIWRYGKLVE